VWLLSFHKSMISVRLGHCRKFSTPFWHFDCLSFSPGIYSRNTMADLDDFNWHAYLEKELGNRKKAIHYAKVERPASTLEKLKHHEAFFPQPLKNPPIAVGATAPFGDSPGVFAVSSITPGVGGRLLPSGKLPRAGGVPAPPP